METTQATQNLPEPGQLVTVRQRHFVVLDVRKSNLPADVLHSNDQAPQNVVSLSSVEDDAFGATNGFAGIHRLSFVTSVAFSALQIRLPRHAWEDPKTT